MSTADLLGAADAVQNVLTVGTVPSDATNAIRTWCCEIWIEVILKSPILQTCQIRRSFSELLG